MKKRFNRNSSDDGLLFAGITDYENHPVDSMDVDIDIIQYNSGKIV